MDVTFGSQAIKTVSWITYFSSIFQQKTDIDGLYKLQYSCIYITAESDEEVITYIL